MKVIILYSWSTNKFHLANQIRSTVNSLCSGHCRDLKLVSSVAEDYLSQMSVICFCSEFIRCPYYRGVSKARVDRTPFTIRTDSHEIIFPAYNLIPCLGRRGKKTTPCPGEHIRLGHRRE